MKPTLRSYRAIRTLGVACVALAGVLGLTATPAARADDATYQHVLQILGQARSYEAVMDIKQSGPDVSPAESSFHLIEIVVRHGDVAEMYTKMNVEGQTIEMAMKGNRICQSVAGHWQCNDMGPQIGAMFKETPERFLKSLGVHVVLKPAGTRSIGGQPAVGYSFAATVAGSRETGTFWLDPSRRRVIEMDSAATDTIAGKTSTLSSRAVFTHWNDPSLKVPAIPGL